MNHSLLIDANFVKLKKIDGKFKENSFTGPRLAFTRIASLFVSFVIGKK